MFLFLHINFIFLIFILYINYIFVIFILYINNIIIYFSDRYINIIIVTYKLDRGIFPLLAQELKIIASRSFKTRWKKF